MRRYIIVFCLILSFCKDDNNQDIDVLKPKACFELYKTNFNTFDTLRFTNCSVNADSFVWDFGDGDISHNKASIHIYKSSGDFKIILTAIKDSLRDTISIKTSIALTPVKAGYLNNNMIHISYKPEYSVKYSFDNCGYGDALDSFDFYNNYIRITCRFLDMQAFTNCCPPPMDCLPSGLNYNISSDIVEFAYYKDYFARYAVIFNYVDTFRVNDRIDNLTNWKKKIDLWNNDVPSSHAGAWYLINKDYYLAIRLNNNGHFKYGWIKVGQQSDRNMIFKEIAIEE